MPSPAARGGAGRGSAESKRDLRICWWIFPAFYSLFGLIFVPLARVMPPPSPGLATGQIVTFFHAHALTIQIGFGLLMVVRKFRYI